MGRAEYVVRFKGDYSALQKDLAKISAATTKLENDEVIIKLNYDGNIAEFNKQFDKIAKMHPELGIQFQYNVNEKMLNQEIDRLNKLTELKLDIDEGRVQGKLETLANNVEAALQEGLSKDEITKRLKDFFGYYNTSIKAGAKNIDFDFLNNKIFDGFKTQKDEIKEIYDNIWGQNDKKGIKLFEIDQSINNDISKTQERVTDLKDALDSLEKKGASKSGLPSELQKVQDEIKILRADISEMQEQLKDLSGEAFNNMTQQIKNTNEQLDIAKDRLKIIQDFLKNNGNSEVLNFTEALNKLQGMLSVFYKENNGNHISSFWDELITKAQDGDAEVLQLLSDLHLLKDTELPEKINAGMVKSGGLIGDDYTVLTTKIHSNKFSGDRLKDAEELKKRLDAISDSGVNAAKTLAIVSDEANNLFVEVQETAPGKMLGQIYGQTEEDWVNTDFFEATDAEILKLIVDLETLRKAGIGVELNAGNLLYEKGKGFSIIDMDLKPLKDYEETISEAQDILFDSIRQFYELQTDKSGNITAEAQTAITALDNFSQKFGDIAEKKKAVIDQLSTAGASNQQITINDAAKEATQKAADALQEAQDSNSPAELTKPLGKDFGAGYAEGIRESLPDIVEACKDIVMGAYNALKESKTSEDGDDINIADGFIESFEENLEKAKPQIQEKIKELFSKIDIGDENGRLFDTFKEKLQEAIDGLGAFPIEVKPYIRKGSEIEEVDLPGGGQNNLSSGTTPSAIDEITQAEDRMGDEAQEATDQAKQGLAEMREEAETLLTIYRGVDQAATQFATINDKPGTFFSFDKNLAEQYAGFSGELLEATADFKDALYIDGKGSDWYNFEYLGNGADEASQKIIALSQKIRNIQEELSSKHWKELGDIGISHSDFTRTNSSTGEVFSVDTPYYMYKEDDYDFIIPLIEKENALESIHNEEVKQLVIELYEAEKAYKRISDAQDNMYGRHSTDEFAELGKKNGYNSIIFENIKDSFDKRSSVSDVGVILDNAIIKQDQFTNSINETTEALKNQVSNETPVSTESTDAETKALLSKKEVIEQLRAELNLTKKAAEDLFDQQGYAKTNSKYQIEQTAVDELIASLKEKKQVEESQEYSTTSPTVNAMQSEVKAVNQAIDTEKKKFDELKNKISKTIPDAIKKKNNAFKEEAGLVSKLVGGEAKEFDNLKNSVDSVTDKVKESQKAPKDTKSKTKTSSNKSDEVDKDALLQKHYTDLRRDAFQSIGQKSQIQQDMSEYYAQLEKDSAKAYSDAKRKANSLLDKVKKLQSSNKYTQDFKNDLNTAETELRTFLGDLASGTISFDQLDGKVKELSDNIEGTLARKAFGSVKQAAEKSLTNVGLKIDQIIAKNSAMGKEFESRFKTLKNRLNGATSVEEVQKIIAEVNRLESELISTGNTGKSFIDQIKQRLRDINSKYIAQYFSFQDIIRYARQAATNVIQLNDAFIELSKVSNTSLETLESDFQSYADIAHDIGGTITDTINATADWARMGMINAPLYGDI